MPPVVPRVVPPVVPRAGRQVHVARRGALFVDGGNQHVAAPQVFLRLPERLLVARIMQPQRAHQRHSRVVSLAGKRVGVRHELIAQLRVLFRDRLDGRVVHFLLRGQIVLPFRKPISLWPQPQGVRSAQMRPCERNEPLNAEN